MQRSKVFGLILTIVFASAIVEAQADIAWHTLTSSNGEFSVTVPSGYIVHKEKSWDEIRIAGGSGGAYFDANLRKTSTGKKWVAVSSNSSNTFGEVKTFDLGENKIYINTFQKAEVARVRVLVGTDDGYYTISIIGPSVSHPIFEQMLASIQLDGQPVVKEAAAKPPLGATVINSKTLESSDVVKEAMRRKQTDEVAIDKALTSDKPEEVIYSRHVIIVDRPTPNYSGHEKAAGIAGDVTVRVLFKRNGNIGKITYVKGPVQLVPPIIEAIKKMKFVPAQVDGASADATVTFVYHRSIGV